VLRQGLVVAAGDPLDLTAPGGDAFTRDLFGGEALALRRLQFTSVSSAMDPLPDGARSHAPPIPAAAALGEALARMVEARSSQLTVVDEAGRACGLLDADSLVERHR
jgi:ABC-type proline/glycine betaine transport system ATPase subunit